MVDSIWNFFPLRSKSLKGFTHFLLHLFIRSAISFNVSFCTNEWSTSEMMNFGSRRRRLAERDFSLQLTVTSGMRRNRTAEDSARKEEENFHWCLSLEIKELRGFSHESSLKIHQKNFFRWKFHQNRFRRDCKSLSRTFTAENGKKLKSFLDLPPTRRIKNEFFIEILHSAEEASDPKQKAINKSSEKSFKV